MLYSISCLIIFISKMLHIHYNKGIQHKITMFTVLKISVLNRFQRLWVLTSHVVSRAGKESEGCAWRVTRNLLGELPRGGVSQHGRGPETYIAPSVTLLQLQ